jgi:hypothetical protein
MGRPCLEPSERRLTLDDALQVDVRQWKKAGRLVPGTWFQESWHLRRSLSAVLGVAVRETDLIFLFKRLDRPFDKLPWSQESTHLIVEPNPVSGSITWIACAGCQRKVYKLYASPNEVVFRCSPCTGLPPKSNLRGRKERLSQRLERINDSLGIPTWVPSAQVPKPTSMRWTRFQSLLAERNRLQAAGIRESQSIFEGVEANRKRREREQELKYKNSKNGVLYFGES